MKRFSNLFSLLIVLCCLWPSVVEAASRFPMVDSASLNGDLWQLPQSFSRRFTFVIVAFHPNQQKALNPLFTELEKLRADNKNIDYIEIPVMDSHHRLSWPVIKNYMKSTVKDKRLHSRIIPFFTDLKAFNQSLSITDTKKSYLLLLDRKANVLWKGSAKNESLRLNQVVTIISN